MMEFVSWDHDIPNWMESHNPVMFQTTNQISYEVGKTDLIAVKPPFREIVPSSMVDDTGGYAKNIPPVIRYEKIPLLSTTISWDHNL